MKRFVLFAQLSCLFGLYLAKDVCYLDLGCFTDSYPFSFTLQRPVGWLPETPEKIGTKFTLYNSNTPPDGERIDADHLGLYFNSSFPTKIIIHGFLNSDKHEWVIEARKALLEVSNSEVNVITVDWSKGNGFPYTQAVANAQVVGAEIAKLIKAFMRQQGSMSSDFHLIGHSLGAHIAGYAGKRLIGLGKITALDPAGPFFEFTDKRVRLSSEDALFVEAIHTDGTANLKLGLGLMQPLGHVDYYPNGGQNQPECPATSQKLLTAIFDLLTVDVAGLEKNFACSHMSSTLFYIDSIKNGCKYQAYSCASQEDFDAGKCVKCGEKGCNRMGYWSEPKKDLGTLYLNTQSTRSKSFCKENYLISLQSNKIEKQLQTRGLFRIQFETKSKTLSSIETLDENKTTFKPDSTENRLVSLNESLRGDEIEHVHIFFKKSSALLASWMYDSKWSFKYVQVFDAQKQQETRYCPSNTVIHSADGSTKFHKC